MGATLAPERTGVLFAKLAKVLGDVGRVPKRGRNDFHKYDYVMEADLADEVREKLAAAGVCVFFSVDELTREDTLSTARCTLTFADGESGETFAVGCWGTGDDKGDKGAYKAFTGAMKYALMKNFLIPTGDDPEADESTDKRAAARAKEHRAATPQPTSAPSPRLEPTRAMQQPAPAAQSGNGHAPQASADRPISEKQRNMLFALSNGAGLAPDEMKASIQALYGVDSSAKLTARQASELIGSLQRIEKGEISAQAWMGEALFDGEPAEAPEDDARQEALL